MTLHKSQLRNSGIRSKRNRQKHNCQKKSSCQCKLVVKSWYCYALITPKKASKICLDRTRICMESLVGNVTCLGMGIHCKYILILKTRVHLRTFNNGHVPSKQILFHHCPCHIQTLQVWSQGPVPSLQSLLHYKKTERL